MSSGHLNAAIANAVVRVQREYVGRGPTKAQAFVRDNVVVVLLEGTLTAAERTLLDAGRGETVLAGRRELQDALRDRLVEAVGELTGRTVVAFLSSSEVTPDMAAEVFVLDRPIPIEP